ncbi:MAG: hypothetical protein HFH92_18525 [Lachnospiraceae bacterium]|nr:hypothetical protein [Lachnospiraceae bacterium]
MRISKKTIYAILLNSFWVMVEIGACLRINDYILSSFLIVALITFAYDAKRVINKYIYHEYSWIWSAFIGLSAISTLINQRFNGFHAIAVGLSLYFICLVFIANSESGQVFVVFRNFMIALAIFTLIDYFFSLGIFDLLKANSVFYSIDPKTNGIASLFEYRHYYGYFLIVGLIILSQYPIRNKIANFAIQIIFIINIVFTYTRNTWLAAIIIFVLSLFKEHKFSRKNLTHFIQGLVVAILIFLVCSVIGVNVLKNISVRLSSMIISLYSGNSVRSYTLREGVRYVLLNWKKYFLLGGGNGFALAWLNENPAGIWGEWTAAIDIQYVTTFMDSGILGIILLAILIYKIVTSYFLLKDKDKNKNIMLLSMTTMFIVICFFEVIGGCSAMYVMWNLLIVSYENKRDRLT